MTKYDEKSIVKLTELEHLRKYPGMYVGDIETPVRLLEELLDNALDEVQSGYGDKIGVLIDTKQKIFKVLDNGRGLPFNINLPIEQDPPVLSATKMFTSAKFDKGKTDSPYCLAAGLHGIGLVACYALSDWMSIDIYRDNIHAIYYFESHNNKIERKSDVYSGATPYSTRVIVKPSNKYFKKLDIDLDVIEERLNIVASLYNNLSILFKVDDKQFKLSDMNIESLLKKYLCNDDSFNWYNFDYEKKKESYNIRFTWDRSSVAPKTFTVVNLCKVEEGAHINKVLSTIKKFFYSYNSTNNRNGGKYNFQLNDTIVGLRLFINLKVINAAYAEQIKKRLSSQTDLSVLDNFEQQLTKYFKEHQDELYDILDDIQNYRNLQNTKKLNIKNQGNKRGHCVYTKLRDCIEENGELIICEGDSAGGGLIKVRDPKKHAILPLRGVVPNALTKADFHENKELKDIILSCGCGIGNDCDANKLRYNKIIIACDADPAGHWITALLITFFVYMMSPIVQERKLFVCRTPLFGYKENNKFVPLWDDKELQKARDEKRKIMRFKGLGEFNPDELKVFTLDEKTRKLICVEYEDPTELFALMSKPEERRKLLGIDEL